MRHEGAGPGGRVLHEGARELDAGLVRVTEGVRRAGIRDAAGGIGIVLTYIYMLMTGLPDVIYSIIFLIRSRRKPSVIMVVGMLMMFVFVLDIVGAFMLKAAYRKLLEQA